MHPNPIFRKTPDDRNIAFARERAFGTLCVNAEAGPLISHVPFLLSEDGTYAEAHLVRSNPIWRNLKEPTQAVIAVTGPDAYISPDWYGVDDQVPTWNYVSVHLRGTLRPLDREDLPRVLAELSAHFEGMLLPKAPWTLDKLTEKTEKSLMAQIMPVAFDVAEINSTWKLSQNKPEEVQAAAIEGLATSSIGSEVEALRDLMAEN